MSATLTAAALGAAGSACAWLSLSEPRLKPRARRWLSACAVVLFATGLMQAMSWDLELLRWGRTAAHDAGLYEIRRPVQALVMLLVWLVLLGVWQRSESTAEANSPKSLLIWGCTAGTAVIAAVFCARTVSLHGIDAMLAFRWHGVSLGRGLEWLSALGICGLCLAHRWDRHALEPALKAWEAPRV